MDLDLNKKTIDMKKARFIDKIRELTPHIDKYIVIGYTEDKILPKDCGSFLSLIWFDDGRNFVEKSLENVIKLVDWEKESVDFDY